MYLDNPGGTQVHRSVIEAMTDYLLHHNANHGGAFVTSQRSDEILHEARLRPDRISNELSTQSERRLHAAIHRILNEGFQHRPAGFPVLVRHRGAGQ